MIFGIGEWFFGIGEWFLGLGNGFWDWGMVFGMAIGENPEINGVVLGI
jgi:hypothetical protein